MNAQRGSLLRHGLLAAGAVMFAALAICMAAAWVWAVCIVPVLPPWLAYGLQATAAGAMIWQSGNLSPLLATRKNNGRMLMKPRTMHAGSVALFAGAALVLAGLIHFRAVTDQPESGVRLRLHSLFLGSARSPRDSQPQHGRPDSSSATTESFGPLGRCCVAQTALASVRRAESTVAMSR